MDFDEYRVRGKEMVDYIADYLQNIRERRVFPDVKPGYMRNLMPDAAPVEGEPWQAIIDDVERVIMPGVTHWQSPHMHAYFPALNSFPSMIGDMLADAINCLGFTWASSPACTELESIVMNWLGKMIGLPDEFLHMPGISKGGGVIQTTASESTMVCLLAGRTLAIRKFHEHTPGLQDAEINARLVAYCSDQAHSSVEKAALIGLVRMRFIESDDNLSMGGRALEEAIEEDIKQGLIPFWVCATLGTTGASSFDNLAEIGDVCQKYKLWLHADAAYAGSAFICPEFRVWLKGIEKADSIAFNPSKWLMVHFDCTAMWVKNSGALHRTFNVEPLYLQHENSGLAIDYMHWQIPLSKRFRALKLWFVLRSFGIKGLQKHIREGVRLAQKFEALVLADNRFEIPAARHLGMVVFRLKGENDLTEKLLKRLNHRGNLHAVPASLKGKYVIRFTITSTYTTNEDLLKDWNEIRTVADELLKEMDIKFVDRSRVALKDTREKNEAFGSSLLLANSPMSPKIVNGSFAAIFDADEFLAKVYAGIRISVKKYLQEYGLSEKAIALIENSSTFPTSDLLPSNDGPVLVVFFPPNVNSLIQPMDQNTKRLTKLYYVESLLASLVAKNGDIGEILKNCCRPLLDEILKHENMNDDDMPLNTLRERWFTEKSEIDRCTTEVAEILNIINAENIFPTDEICMWNNCDSGEERESDGTDGDGMDSPIGEVPPKISADEAISILTLAIEWAEADGVDRSNIFSLKKLRKRAIRKYIETKQKQNTLSAYFRKN
ncbi:histidine decarboxylase isoform X2 [Toxorhynchites rutilus septentrionalis]|uniref:histidine decarboxylase isoform X2 n=1 Tax=Toxorhynchites rutilus septentrionalis TaxID=329112 RepID=UPI002479F38E|nr:histidine decarboxylase isoform X2 [Toxorhynchites rutilus septentrionalis]